jgi:putative membrane protein
MGSILLARNKPATVSAGAVLAVGAILIAGRDLGPLSLHMSVHILAMNVAAPISAALLVTRSRSFSPAWVWAAGLVQLAALWGAHLPSVHSATAASHLLQIVMHGILLLASLSFWSAVLALPDSRRWHAIAALLLSGKIVCFLAVLLVFAPRALYGNHHYMPDTPALADQQIAGLLMIAACPLSYLLAAIIITVQLINQKFGARLERTAS